MNSNFTACNRTQRKHRLHDLTDLTPFATIRRYQEGTAELEQDDISGAIQMAADVLSWTENLLRPLTENPKTNV